MAERPIRIITKRTAVPGKIPSGTTGTELNLIKAGELASNLADRKLYSYDGSEVFEYGTKSFLGLTGGTITGNTNFLSGVTAGTLTISGISEISGQTRFVVVDNNGKSYYQTSGGNGSSGSSGISGANGSSGSSGSSGSAGSAGSSGSAGSAGVSGSSGTSGLAGSSGSSGSAGVSGSAGTSGTGFNAITNPLDDRVLTSLGTTNTANAEANLRFNGTRLQVQGQTSGQTLSDESTLNVIGYGLFAHNIYSFSAGASDRYVLAGASDVLGNFRFAGIRYDRTNNVTKFGHYLNSGLIESGYISINTGGTIGIGINNATARLHVNNTTTDNTVLFEDSTNPDNSPFVVNNNGDVGIGIISPTEKLHVSGNTVISGNLTISGVTGTTTRVVEVNSAGLVSANSTIVTAYITSGGTAANLLENTSNWDIDGVYIGATITGTYQGQKHYNGNYFFEAVADNVFIRLIRG